MVVMLRLLVVMTAALVFAGAGQARQQTTVPDRLVSIHVTITDSRIVLDRHSAPRGVEGRFVIKNIGTKTHNFTLAAAGPGSTPVLSRTLGPRRQAVVSLFLDYRGQAEYLDRLRADRSKRQMHGVFVVL
jgi:hypothetical protein